MEKENLPKYITNHQECGKFQKKETSMPVNQANYYFHLGDVKSLKELEHFVGPLNNSY